MSETRLDYMLALDGLRAVAILGVVVYHVAPKFAFGMIGVDVFFVLSGFLITALIARQIQTKGFSRRRFYLRRAIRLGPALLVTVAFFTPIGIVVMTDESTWSGAAAAILYLTPFAPTTIFQHTWTLAFEEWFYLLWPLALGKFMGDGLTLRQAAALVGFVGVAIQATMLAEPSLGVARPSALAVGVALGLWWLDGGQIHRPSLALGGGLGIILVGAFAGPLLYGPMPYWLAVVGSALAIAGIASGGAGIVLKVLESAPLVAVGVVSYEWYLLNFPMLRVSDELWSRWSYLAAVPLSLMLAFALHHLMAPVQARLRGRLDHMRVSTRTEIQAAD